jgi:hypothetical protein
LLPSITTGEAESRTSPSEIRSYMQQMTAAAVRSLDAGQAAELSLLVELEARWENLRKTPRTQDQEARSVPDDLRAIQNAYEAFHSQLIAYNKRYTPAHVPELLLNTPSRLALWCRTMRELYLRVENDPRSRCPVHLLAKANRCAARISVRMNKGCFSALPSPPTIRVAIENLGALSQWCDDLASVATTP